MEENKIMSASHKVMMQNRKGGTITGITDVLSFDVKEILLETTQGMLLIKGNDLHVNRLLLEKGEVELDGKIDSLTYSEMHTGQKQGESLFSRMFK